MTSAHFLLHQATLNLYVLHATDNFQIYEE